MVDWANVELAITAGDLNEDGQATVYIAYYRGGIDVQNENVAAIANMCFIADEDPALVEGDESVDPIEGGGIEDNTEPDIESTIEDDDMDELILKANTIMPLIQKSLLTLNYQRTVIRWNCRCSEASIYCKPAVGVQTIHWFAVIPPA